jgi:CRISPR-associated protein Csb2
MSVLMLRFPGRRYHATPWGHHVNEGLIEWPPSPWRLLRALLSVGYSALGWDGSPHEPWRSQPPVLAQALLAKLAGTLPHYHLPAAVGTHSRHYMPLAVLEANGREKTTLVFDTWAQVDSGELGVRWDVELTEDEHVLMATLARHLSYLGRSESWVEARWLRDATAEGFAFDMLPCDEAVSPGPKWEQVALLALQPEPDFLAWRGTQVERALAPLPLPEGKKRMPTALAKKRAAAIEPFPDTILACLQTDTTWQRSYGWSQPPGSRKVLYWRRADALKTAMPLGARSTLTAPPVPFVLLALATASGNLHALPPLARSLPQGEMLHRQVVAARLKLAPAEAPSVLGGCDDHGKPLAGPHQHAHLLSLDLDDDGHIDHLLAWAPQGLDALDQRALCHARGTYTKGGVGELSLSWAGAGSRIDLLRLTEPFGSTLRRTLGTARTWWSATPFVPPRHLKRSGRNTLVGQVQAELASRGLPPATMVEVLDAQSHELARRQRHHVRRRRSGPPPPTDQGYTLRLSFDAPTDGPLCIGYGSHFGLGRFEIVDAK